MNPQPRIVKLAPNIFRFEYEDVEHIPKLKTGLKFRYDHTNYRIVHYSQVFGENAYCSFLVMARLSIKNKRLT
jgi:hypothetical protein